jgi:hypothetical protein
MKLVFPMVWLTAFATATLLLFTETLAFDPAPPQQVKWMFPAFLLAGAASL